MSRCGVRHERHVNFDDDDDARVEMASKLPADYFSPLLKQEGMTLIQRARTEAKCPAWLTDYENEG